MHNCCWGSAGERPRQKPSSAPGAAYRIRNWRGSMARFMPTKRRSPVCAVSSGSPRTIPAQPRANLSIAEAALTARLWGEARRHLTLAVARHRRRPFAATVPADGAARRRRTRRREHRPRMVRPRRFRPAGSELFLRQLQRRKRRMAFAVPEVRQLRYAHLAQRRRRFRPVSSAARSRY